MCDSRSQIESKPLLRTRHHFTADNRALARALLRVTCYQRPRLLNAADHLIHRRHSTITSGARSIAFDLRDRDYDDYDVPLTRRLTLWSESTGRKSRLTCVISSRDFEHV